MKLITLAVSAGPHALLQAQRMAVTSPVTFQPGTLSSLRYWLLVVCKLEDLALNVAAHRLYFSAVLMGRMEVYRWCEPAAWRSASQRPVASAAPVTSRAAAPHRMGNTPRNRSDSSRIPQNLRRRLPRADGI